MVDFSHSEKANRALRMIEWKCKIHFRTYTWTLWQYWTASQSDVVFFGWEWSSWKKVSSRMHVDGNIKTSWHWIDNVCWSKSMRNRAKNIEHKTTTNWLPKEQMNVHKKNTVHRTRKCKIERGHRKWCVSTSAVFGGRCVSSCVISHILPCLPMFAQFRWPCSLVFHFVLAYRLSLLCLL